MPKSLSKFGDRISICKLYRGLRGEELRKVSGIHDSEFVHSAGFIGGAWSLKSAIQMAESSIAEHHSNKEAPDKTEENSETPEDSKQE